MERTKIKFIRETFERDGNLMLLVTRVDNGQRLQSQYVPRYGSIESTYEWIESTLLKFDFAQIGEKPLLFRSK